MKNVGCVSTAVLIASDLANSLCFTFIVLSSCVRDLFVFGIIVMVGSKFNQKINKNKANSQLTD